MKKPIFILLLLITAYALNAQKIATKKIKVDPYGLNLYPFNFDNFLLVQDYEKSFIISKYKTSNKEYLCFLQWLYRVFGEDHPEIYKEMLPDTINHPDIFNPKKLNMPVKGVTQWQAQAFCHWRSDRLNEYILVKERILYENFHQFNESNFNTEAYLSGKYEQLVRNDLLDKTINKVRQVYYSDYFLIPVFYIASKEELKICQSLSESTRHKRKRKIKCDVDWWFSNELKLIITKTDESPLNLLKSKLLPYSLSDMGKIYTFIKKSQKELANNPIEFDTIDVIISEKDFRLFNLHEHKSQMRFYNLLADSLPNPFKRDVINEDKKNKYGKMDFIYIANNYDGTPICIDYSVFEEDLTNNVSNSGFYCAMNLPYNLLLSLLIYPRLLQYRY